MLNITVNRKHFSNTCTLGEMFINGAFFAHTIEDVVRTDGVKVQDMTAIPKGKYKVVISYSNHFKRRMPELKDVPMFSGVRIHGGNTDKDTEGCILIGADTNGVDRISNCAAVNEQLIEHIESANECWITIS